MLTKDLAICIRATDYSETSQIVTFFTRENGKITAIAKGSKRPKSAFDGPIEVLSFGEIVFSDSRGERLCTLTEFQQQSLRHVLENLFTLNCCLFAAELVNGLTHDFDPHSALFDSFLRFLQVVQEKRSDRQKVLSSLILFQLILLKQIGLQPILTYCVNCKTRYEMRPLPTTSRGVIPAKVGTRYEGYFSSSANGLICRDCEGGFPDKIKLSREALQCLANVNLIGETGENALQEIENVLIHHFTETLGRRPKMAKYILKS